MGSQLRRLRKQAGVAGYDYQAELRREARKAARVREASPKDAHAEQRARKDLTDAHFKRLMTEMSERAAARREEEQLGCIDPVLFRDMLEGVAANQFELPQPLHVAQYLSPIEAKAAGLGEVCRVCGKAKPTSVVVDATGISAAAAIAQAGAALIPEPAGPAPSAPQRALHSGVEPAPLPREPGMRRLARPSSLLPLLAVAALALSGEPPKERR